jgi:hypothetical protein
MRFYGWAKVPAICDGVPREVSGVHFRSDLTRVEPLSETNLLIMSETASPLLPR